MALMGMGGKTERRSLAPLRRMAPYVSRYRGLMAGALFFLVLAALATLSLPLAVRRMIDHGFTTADTTFVANYFAMLLAIAVVLAMASACRYYFVITLGERVVSDIRRDVFAHVARLSPAFFDAVQSGEIVLSTDLTSKDDHVAIVGNHATHTIHRKTKIIDAQEKHLVPLLLDGPSTEKADVVAKKAKSILKGFKTCGCTLNNPNMQLSLLALVVIPRLRISDQGLVDVTQFKFIPVLEG